LETQQIKLRRVFIDGGKKYDKLMQQSEQEDTKIKISADLRHG
jgi:hypothetical protein